MRVGRFALVILLVVPLSGCINNVLDGTPERSPETKVDLQESFSAEESLDPDQPDRFGKVRTVTFTVAEGERDLSIEIEVRFEQDSPSDPIPSGNVTVTLSAPDDEQWRWTFQRSRTQSTVIDPPATGMWDLEIQAQGQGTYEVLAESQVPQA